ncbi:MAG: response regulator [Casimicrobiaceae bacterium]
MGNRVLIADDEPNIVISLEFLMTQQGFEVRIARNGDEALALAESFIPDVVLLDVTMPMQSGYEVARKIRDNPALQHVKIIMLTARGRDTEASKGIAMGADLYVTKPFSTRELVDQVRAMVT